MSIFSARMSVLTVVAILDLNIGKVKSTAKRLCGVLNCVKELEISPAEYYFAFSADICPLTMSCWLAF